MEAAAAAEVHGGETGFFPPPFRGIGVRLAVGFRLKSRLLGLSCLGKTVANPLKRNCTWCRFYSEEDRRKRGLPDGYCAVCQECGQPGHLRQPFPAMHSSRWCDKCNRKFAWRVWLTPIGFIVLVIIALLISLVVTAIRDFL